MRGSSQRLRKKGETKSETKEGRVEQDSEEREDNEDIKKKKTAFLVNATIKDNPCNTHTNNT